MESKETPVDCLPRTTLSRKNLVATGTMGFPPNHSLPLAAVEWMKATDFNRPGINRKKTPAWQSVGPGLLTRLYDVKDSKDKRVHKMTIFPSYYFLPVHCRASVSVSDIRTATESCNLNPE